MDYSSRSQVVGVGSYDQQPNNSLVEEESGWTSYFEDLELGVQEEDGDDHSSSSSMVSDAASNFPAWKKSSQDAYNNINHHHQQHVVAACSFMGGSVPLKKLNFMKKTRAKEFSCDESLEDTASSPVNSPKVSELARGDMNPRKTNHYFNDTSMCKGGSVLAGEEEKERCGMEFNGSKINCTDLEKRGLCLVPLSLLVNYMG